jgi:hypothetical protein
LGYYQYELAQRARQLSDEIIDADVVELNNTSLIETRVGTAKSEGEDFEDRSLPESIRAGLRDGEANA